MGASKAAMALALWLAASGRASAQSLHLAMAVALGPERSMEAAQLSGQGKADVEAGKLDKAVVAFRHSLALAPQAGGTWVDLGCALADLERWEEARSAFKQALSMHANDPAALNGLGYVHFRTDHTQDAIDCYRKALTGRDDPQYHLNLGLAYLSQQAWGQASDEFSRSVAAQPNDYWSNNDLAFALQQSGQWRAAAERYQAAIGVAKDDITAHLNLGGLLLDARSFDDAVTIYQDALKHQDQSYEGHLGLAVGLAQLGRLGEAQREARVAVSLGPDKAKARHLLGQIYQKEGRWGEAIAEANRAVMLAPKEATYRLGLAHAYDGAGRNAEAAASYDRFVELAPDGEESREAKMRARLLR